MINQKLKIDNYSHAVALYRAVILAQFGSTIEIDDAKYKVQVDFSKNSITVFGVGVFDIDEIQSYIRSKMKEFKPVYD